MTSAPSSEGASTPEESYAETTPLGVRDVPDDKPVVPKKPRARKGKAEGQWKLGYREPLNKNEQSKKDDHPLNVRARIENIYAHRGFDSIDPADLRGRFRWMGLYTQRAEGIPGTDTGHLEEEELDARHFMMRVRVDGGALTTEQLRVIGEISQTFARDTADVTDRENIQLHWIRVEDVPEIWRRLEAVGLYTTEACGDCPRVVLGSPVAGISADEVIDGSPAIAEIVERFIGDRSLANLPRKYKTAISGQQDVAHEVNDISFVGVVHPEHGPGFDLHVGGGLSTNPKLAVRLGAWVPLDEVPDVWHGVTQVFRDYGYRRLRTRARLKFLIADWGPEKFRQVLEDEYLGRKLVDGPAPDPIAGTIDHVGVHDQVDGKSYVGVAPPAGRTSGSTLVGVAKAAEDAGSTRVRLTPYQKILVLDVPSEQLDTLTAALDHLGLPARPSVFRRATMACTGIEFCKLAFVDTKERARTLVEDLEQRLAEVAPELETPISIHLNGCPNSCARVQVADIGLKGQIVNDAEGNPAAGFQVHLGGGLGLDSGFGRKLRGHKVLSDELGPYVERVVRSFVEHREDGERFAQWVVRAEEGQLS
ncbi:nitrite/sulfite reductase [Actinomycetospora sp. TBRC 11914]|uniref:nitrite/sulfite reductase n=1 Tax=Actinomycetospora sp. TBRC 11914 TaxID=2729387 RepID=UPI00145FB432|nr:nitrite/sulfite reductase [Actinomycetospora sp. TBRC 11914]NMO93154.1 nitrite/sulfite reductase [Actinomycetospora sp. TBRC 11914]